MASTINASNTGFGGIVQTGDSSGQLQLQTAGTTAVTIDTSQNVGIGTTTTTGGKTTIQTTSTTAPGGVALLLSDSTGSSANQFGIAFNSAVTGNAGSARLNYFVDAGGATAGLTFLTGGTSPTERMRIDSSGNVKLSTANTVIQNSSGNPILQQTGSILQVVSTTKTDTFTTTTTGSYVDITGMSVSITPTSASSKILVIFSGNAAGTTGSSGWLAQLVRNSTAICVGTSVSNRAASSTGGATPDSNWSLPTSINYLDSPATTSAVTYKIQGRVGAGTFYFNRSQTDSDSSGYIRAASTITVMEIAA